MVVVDGVVDRGDILMNRSGYELDGGVVDGLISLMELASWLAEFVVLFDFVDGIG